MKGYVLRGDNESQKYVIQANLDFLDLCKYAEFTQMTDINADPYEAGSKQTEEFYQRRVAPQRVKEIIKYARMAILETPRSSRHWALFPTTMLLAAHWELDSDLKIDDFWESESFYEGLTSLYIVDGQHRLFSLKQLYGECQDRNDEESVRICEYLRAYKFNCTLLVNYDMWEQAQVFADVNFNQKSVNKSLYYSIYGMRPPRDGDMKRSHIYVAHQLTRFMNDSTDSPLFRCIKMLGTGRGFISQSFFADSLIRHLVPRGIWYNDYQSDPNDLDYRYMSTELISFFVAVKNVFGEEWPATDGTHKSIIAKTTGIGALIRLMAYIHETFLPTEILIDLKSDNIDRVSIKYVELVTNLLRALKPYQYFSFQGNFAGTGGKGLEVRLYEAMKSSLDSGRDKTNVKGDFDLQEESHVMTDYKDWLSNQDLYDYEDVDSLYNAVYHVERYGIFEARYKDDNDDQILVSSDLGEEQLSLPIEKKSEFLRYIEKTCCDDMDEEAWYSYHRAMEKDD